MSFFNFLRRILGHSSGATDSGYKSPERPILDFNSTNKIKSLEKYTEEFAKYYYDGYELDVDYHPNVLAFLNNLSEEECNCLELDLESWSDDMLLIFTEPVSQTANNHIDGSFIFCKIFLQIDDHRLLDYFFPELYGHTEKIQQNPGIEFYQNLLQKAKELIPKYGESWEGWMSGYEQTVNAEIARIST